MPKYSRGNVLIIDDENSLCEMLKMMLYDKGLKADYFTSPSRGLSMALKKNYDVALVDLMMPEIDGIEVLKRLKESSPETEVIMVSAFGTIDKVKESLRFNAYDFIEKPFDIDKLSQRILSAVEMSKQKKSDNVGDKNGNNNLDAAHSYDVVHSKRVSPIGADSVFKNVIDMTIRAANADTTVLITGETGTGKELIANLIYDNSARRGRPFIKINCPSIAPTLYESELFGYEKGSFTGAYKDAEGKFSAAQGGVMFLDEIGDMPLDAQAKLLRVLQYKEYSPVGSTKVLNADVRVIAATNFSLPDLVKKGLFREDLYYRLNLVNIHLPPLRERQDDIMCLVEHFNDVFSKKYGEEKKKFSKDVIDIFKKYSWPGNIREMENLVERMFILFESEKIELAQLPEQIHRLDSSINNCPTFETLEKAYIYYLLSKSDWDKKSVASILGVDLSTLYRKLARYGLDNAKDEKNLEIDVKGNLELVEKAILYYFINAEKFNLTDLAFQLGYSLEGLKEKLRKYGLFY